MTAQPPASTWPHAPAPPGRLFGIGLALCAAYIALEWISEVHEHQGLPVTAWHPGLGLLFAAMILWPVLGAAILFAGMVAAEILVVDSILGVGDIAGLAALSATTYAGCAWLARRWLRLDPGIARARDIAALLATGVVAGLANATLLTLLLLALGSITWNDIADAAVPLAVGDIIGIAVITPLILRLWHAEPGWFRAARAQRLAAGLAGLDMVSFLLLWLILGRRDPAALIYLYALFLPVVGAALWLGLDGACVSLAIAQCLLILLLRLYGYDASALTAFQSAMMVLSATGLLCGAVVTERDAANGAARRAQARLAAREAEAVRADRLSLATGMTSALSHEITQPITAARSLARAAQLRLNDGRAPDTARLRENLAGIVGQIDLAAEILNRMRNFVGRGAPEQTLVEAERIVQDALALLRPRAARHHVALDVISDPNLPALRCDHIQIQQVLINLIGNALDAIAGMRREDRSDDAGRITLRVGLMDGANQILFCVQDNGPGIPPALAPHVFDVLTTDKPEGLGLGLSICALIVEAHGGRIWLENSGPAGTDFRFWLPAIESERTT